MFLTDLVFIYDGNPDMLDDELINFSKFSKIGKTLLSIVHFQEIRYPFPIDESLLRSLLRLKVFDETEAYTLSLKLEPREATEAIEALMLEEERLRVEISNLQMKLADLEVFISFTFHFLEKREKLITNEKKEQNKRLNFTVSQVSEENQQLRKSLHAHKEIDRMRTIRGRNSISSQESPRSASQSESEAR